MKPDVQAFFDEQTFTVTYVLKDPSSRACAIIDPVLDFDPAASRSSTASVDEVLQFVEDKGLEVTWILETHAHADHLSAAAYVKAKTGGKSATGKWITEVQSTFKDIFNLGDDFLPNGEQFDRLLDDGDLLELGGMSIRIMHTPGHTPGSACFQLGNDLIAGDTLFVFGCGRCDLQGGDPEQMFNTLRRIKSELPGDTILHPGHNYAPTHPTSTMASQCSGNPFLHFDNADDFVEYRMRVHDRIRQTPYKAVSKKQALKSIGR